MIKSMTGFASVTRDDELATVGVTVRSVNHRHLDAVVRLPQYLQEAESRLRAILQRHLARGRVEMTVSVQLRRAGVVTVDVNDEVLRALDGALDAARARGMRIGDLSAGDVLRVPQAVTIREQSLTEDSAVAARLADVLEEAAEDATRALDRMRATEGEYLRADLDARRRAVGAIVEQVVVAAEEGRVETEARLAKRIRELSVDVQADPAAVAQEIVRFVARSDISEEVTRFHGHLAHWDALSDSPEPCGRKLDFLLQEMNREVNTMGSKAEGGRIGELIVSAKAELEKMREQVQNVE